MKWILSFTVFVLCLNTAQANFFSFKSEELGSPFYRQTYRLQYQTQKPESGSVSVSLVDKSGRSLEEKWNVRVRKTDFQNCNRDMCSLDVFELPLTLEKYACFADVMFVNASNQHVDSVRLKWGDCLNVPPAPERKYLPDLQFDESAILDPSGVTVINNGFSLGDANLTLWAYLKDKNNTVIWTGVINKDLDLETSRAVSLPFSSPLKTWQAKLGCKMTVIIDPDFAIIERTKKNNTAQFENGDCEDVPSELKGDLFDFSTSVEEESHSVAVMVQNLGRLPFLSATSKLELRLTYRDIKNLPLMTKNVFAAGPLYGFNDSLEAMSEVPPLGTCIVEVEVNPNIFFKESNYSNNRSILNLCK